MRSFSVRPSRLILVPSAHPVTRPCAIPSQIIPVGPPVTCPFAIPSHIILVNPSSHTPLCLSVPHHPRQPLQSHALVPFRPRSSPSALQSHALVPFHFIQHFVPPLRFFSPCPRPSGKVPGISAKTVHFPPRPAGAPAPQASLAALGISTPGESAGFFHENGSLSPVAGRGTDTIDLSGRTWHFHPRGKCREFRRKRFTFPRGRPGYRLHRPLWLHLAFPPLGKVPGISAKTVHFPPWHETSGDVQQSLFGKVPSIQAL